MPGMAVDSHQAGADGAFWHQRAPGARPGDPGRAFLAIPAGV
jgi:hypothetical protein